MAKGDVGPAPIMPSNNRFDPNSLGALNPLPPVPPKPTTASSN